MVPEMLGCLTKWLDRGQDSSLGGFRAHKVSRNERIKILPLQKVSFLHDVSWIWKACNTLRLFEGEEALSVNQFSTSKGCWSLHEDKRKWWGKKERRKKEREDAMRFDLTELTLLIKYRGLMSQCLCVCVLVGVLLWVCLCVLVLWVSLYDG